MDMTIQREALLKPLQAVSGIVEKKQTLPILSNVLLTLKQGVLQLIGTDLEIELVGLLPIEAPYTEGTTTVSARKLFDICRTLPEGCCLRLSLEKNYLVVKAGDSCFMLNTLPSEDFPSLESSDYPAQFTIKQYQLKQLLAKTYFAMSQQDVRHYLNGAFLDISQHAIKCVAADGHRLAMTTFHDDKMNNIEARVILPRKSVLELIRLLAADEESEVTIYLNDHRFRTVTNDYTFTSKLINAQYPDYNRLIPQGTTVAIGDRETIKQALTRASILSSEKYRGVRFTFDKGKLQITANNSDREQADEAVPLDYTGNKIEIGFNVAYLLDIVSTITEKSIRCIFTGPNEGVLIEPVESNHPLPLLCRYVVMPMRL